MSELVNRLANGRHRLVFGKAERNERIKDLKAAIDRKYVLLKFTETRGGTELGMRLDEPACRLDSADFGNAQGRIHLEGELKLDYVAVRMIADLDLATFEGEGQLQIVAAPSA